MNTQAPPDPYTSANPSGSASNNARAGESSQQMFSQALKHLAEVREYVFYYLAAKADALKLTVTKIAFLAVVGVVGLLAAATAAVVAVVLLMGGIAGGLGALFGGRVWLGDLIVSIVFFVLLAAGAWFGLSALTGSSRTKTVKKYESRKQQQRVQFGHDVAERASHSHN